MRNIVIISGEGDGEGTIENYKGTGNVMALRRRYNKEICNGDRWCKITTKDRSEEFNPFSGLWM